MTIKTKLIEYMDGEEVLEAYMSWDDKSDKSRPGVLIGHAWAGRTNFECEKADEIAKLGYVGFALDMYGKGVNGESKEENARLMSPFIENREKLQKRMFLALEALKKQAPVDNQKLAAIGYCFGGLMALDLARCGADILGAISFHGNLSKPNNTIDTAVKAKIMVLHGWEDPMVGPESVNSFINEMRSKNTDWQVHAYGNAMHAFTKTDANDPENGMQYNQKADHRSWTAMHNFLEEVFN